MKERNLKMNTVVIMDGTNQNTVEYITAMLREWSPVSSGEPVVYPMSRNYHPSKMVVKTEVYEDELDKLNSLIERRFPGLCMFNPPMAV